MSGSLSEAGVAKPARKVPNVKRVLKETRPLWHRSKHLRSLAFEKKRPDRNAQVVEHFVGRRDKLIQMQTPQQQWETTKKAYLCQQTKMINLIFVSKDLLLIQPEREEILWWVQRIGPRRQKCGYDKVSASGATSIPPCNKKYDRSQDARRGYLNIRN